MKNLIVVVGVLLLLSFTSGYEPKNSTAEVEQIQGCYVFVDSRPVKEYKFLGAVKCDITWGSGQYQDVRDELIRRVRKKFPDANGIILHPHDGGRDLADAIQFNQ